MTVFLTSRQQASVVCLFYDEVYQRSQLLKIILLLLLVTDVASLIFLLPPSQEGRVESKGVDLDAAAVRVQPPAHLLPSLLPRQLVPVLPPPQTISQPPGQPEPLSSKPQPVYTDIVRKSRSIMKYVGKICENN